MSKVELSKEELLDIKTALRIVADDFKGDGWDQATPDRYEALIEKLNRE